MSKVFTFLLTLFPKLAMLFYFCKCPFFLCFSFVLFLLLIGVGFKLNLIPFWGCLSFVLCAFVCFIGSFEPFRTRLSMLSLTLWPNCSELDKRINMVPFLLVATLVFVLYLKRSLKSTKCLCLLWWVIDLILKKSICVLHVRPILTTHGKIFWPFNFHYCLNLGKVNEYSCIAKVLWSMTPFIPSNTSCTPFLRTLSLHLFLIISLNTYLSWLGFYLPKPWPLLLISLQVGFLGWYMNIFWNVSYKKTILRVFEIISSYCCCCCLWGYP